MSEYFGSSNFMRSSKRGAFAHASGIRGHKDGYRSIDRSLKEDTAAASAIAASHAGLFAWGALSRAHPLLRVAAGVAALDSAIAAADAASDANYFRKAEKSSLPTKPSYAEAKVQGMSTLVRGKDAATLGGMALVSRFLFRNPRTRAIVSGALAAGAALRGGQAAQAVMRQREMAPKRLEKFALKKPKANRAALDEGQRTVTPSGAKGADGAKGDAGGKKRKKSDEKRDLVPYKGQMISRKRHAYYTRGGK